MTEGPRLEGRNGDIWRAYLAGSTQESIAEKHGIHQTRVGQILAEVRKTIPEVTKEEVFQRELDFLDSLREKMMEQVASPLPPAFNQRGQILVDEKGNVVRDDSSRLAALDRAIKLHERTTKMLGLDAATKVDVAVSEQATEAARASAADAAGYLSGG